MFRILSAALAAILFTPTLALAAASGTVFERSVHFDPFGLLLGLVASLVLLAAFLPRRIRLFPVVLLAVALLSLGMEVAFAQTTITSTAPSDTTINVGQLLAPWLQGLIAAAVAVIMALFGWITQVINKRAGLEGNAAVMQMEEYARNALDSGLTTAAGWIIMKAGPSLDQMTFDVKSPLIVQGISVLNNLAGDAIAKFGLTPDDLAKKLIAKIGVVTAPNPSVTPTTTVTAPTA